jgi:hypothetical protein
MIRNLLPANGPESLVRNSAGVQANLNRIVDQKPEVIPQNRLYNLLGPPGLLRASCSSPSGPRRRRSQRALCRRDADPPTDPRAPERIGDTTPGDVEIDLSPGGACKRCGKRSSRLRRRGRSIGAGGRLDYVFRLCIKIIKNSATARVQDSSTASPCSGDLGLMR